MSKVFMWYMESINTLSCASTLYVLSNWQCEDYDIVLPIFLKKEQGYESKLLG